MGSGQHPRTHLADWRWYEGTVRTAPSAVTMSQSPLTHLLACELTTEGAAGVSVSDHEVSTDGVGTAGHLPQAAAF